MATRAPNGWAAADLETIVLDHVEPIRQRMDVGVAEPRVVVPAEAALVERDRGENIENWPPTMEVGCRFVGRVGRQRDAVAVQASFDAPDLMPA